MDTPAASRPNLGVLGDLFRDEVLSRLSATDLAMVGRVGDSELRKDVVGSGLSRAGTANTPLNLVDFIGSVDRLSWAVKTSGAQKQPHSEIKWGSLEDSICTRIAEQGNLEVLHWVLNQKLPPPWDGRTVFAAVLNGHTHILNWLGEVEGERTGFDTLASINIDDLEPRNLPLFANMLSEMHKLPDRETEQQRAASGGHCAMLKFMYRAGLPHHADGEVNGYGEPLDRDTYLDYYFGPPYNFDHDTVLDLGVRAAKGGHGDALMWLCEGFPYMDWDFRGLVEAVSASAEGTTYENEMRAARVGDDLYRLATRLDEQGLSDEMYY
jgi:hypothetical protein